MNWESILQQQSGWTPESAQKLRLTPEDALTLYNEAPLHQLMSAAHNRRIAMHGPSKVTYLVDRNINYTNVCFSFLIVICKEFFPYSQDIV